jgi:transcriptional regulator with XRE-family HTH domain
MQIKLSRAEEIGPLVRATRKAQGLRQDDTAGAIGVSENFLGKIEHGADTAQWTKLFQVLQGLGIHVILDLPEEARSYLPKGNEAAE